MGALLRYQLGRAMTALLSIQPVGGFPWPTFAANGIGGLGMGLLVGCLARGLGGDFEEPARLMLGVGLLGGFTTFSSFSLDVVNLIDRGAIGIAAFYVLTSVVASILAVFAGLAMTRAVA